MTDPFTVGFQDGVFDRRQRAIRSIAELDDLADIWGAGSPVQELAYLTGYHKGRWPHLPAPTLRGRQ